jgi:hypothetical protein
LTQTTTWILRIFLDQLEQLFVRCSDQLVHFLALLVDLKRGHGSDSSTRRNRIQFVHVYFNELDGRILFGVVFENWFYSLEKNFFVFWFRFRNDYYIQNWQKGQIERLHLYLLGMVHTFQVHQIKKIF